MDEKMRALQEDIDLLNPRHRIEQAIKPRIERTREKYSVEPEIFTRTGKRVLKRPQLQTNKIESQNRKQINRSKEKTTTNKKSN